MLSQRFVDNNPQAVGPCLSLQVAPQEVYAIPRRSGEASTGQYVPPGHLDFADFVWISYSANVYVATGLPTNYSTLKFLYIDTNASGVYAKKYSKRSIAQLEAEGANGDWFLVGTSLFMFSDGASSPAAKGWSIRTPEAVVNLTNLNSRRNLQQHRYIYHPSLGGFEYHKPPDRTMNYHRSAIRGYDVDAVKTLRSSVTVKDMNRWEDVVITEVWEAPQGKLSVETEFFDALHMIYATEVPLGSHVSWVPKDLSFQRHLIQPVSLQLGSQEVDAREWRSMLNSSRSSYLDRQVTFSFRLIRGPRLVDSLLTAVGY